FRSVWFLPTNDTLRWHLLLFDRSSSRIFYDKLDRTRLVPYQLHINVDVIECVHLICLMLLETSQLVSQQNEMRRKLLSRSFHYHLKQIWSLLRNANDVKGMLIEQIRVEPISSHIRPVSLGMTEQLFELNKPKIISVITYVVAIEFKQEMTTNLTNLALYFRFIPFVCMKLYRK
uniref:Eukaryotic translation initiation factor 3 subunit C N-terminal domain-containing protein n=1 Tax=Parascaris univalens TaxID=6257 RepID=A0A915A5R5_PARUN